MVECRGRGKVFVSESKFFFFLNQSLTGFFYRPYYSNGHAIRLSFHTCLFSFIFLNVQKDNYCFNMPFRYCFDGRGGASLFSVWKKKNKDQIFPFIILYFIPALMMVSYAVYVILELPSCIARFSVFESGKIWTATCFTWQDLWKLH